MAVNQLVLPEGQASSYHNLDEIYTTTLQNWRKNGKFYDNIFKTNPLFWLLHEKGQRQTWDGGNPIMCNLQYGKNSTIGSYSRYDLIDTTPQDNQTAAYYYMRQLGGTINIDNFSALSNAGKHQIQNLIKAKIKEAEMSMAEEINTQLWKGTPGAKDIDSIPKMIYHAAAGAGTWTDDASPGEISGNSYSWWRNRHTVSTDISTWALLKFHMRNVYNNCTKGAAMMDKNKLTGNGPDLLLCNQETYEAYEGAVDDDKRYVDPLAQKGASMGFEFMKYKRALMYWDEMCYDAYTGVDYGSRAEGAIYFLNTNFLHYYVSSAVDLEVKPFVEPYNQDARTSKILHYHCLAMSNRAKQGVLGYIDTALSA